MKSETIAAIATSLSNSGIGIVRVSGENAIETVDRIFRAKNKKKKIKSAKTHTLLYGFIYDGDTLIDEVIVAIMKRPYSYTKEDTIEIDCHGGSFVTQRVLECVLKNGARLADPGEFTKRAFLNGRIDLSEAEAVMDVIQSKNEFALNASISQLNGNLYKTTTELRKEILYEIAFIESALDDPEHISLEGYSEKLLLKIQKLLETLTHLLSVSENGQILKEGIKTVIVGKPNAGKSSLLNRLLGEDRAIVTSIAGTTRDVLEENIRLQGLGLRIIDTAGIRNTEDEVEKIGVDKAKKFAMNADLIVFVVDSSVKIDESDKEIIQLVRNKRVIVLLNKTDLKEVVSQEDVERLLYEEGYNNFSYKVIKTSTIEDIGIDDFEKAVFEMFMNKEIVENEEVFITSARHMEAFKEARNSLLLVYEGIEKKMPEDFLSIDLMSAYSSLGRIIGEEVEEDLVNEIFAKFCTGK